MGKQVSFFMSTADEADFVRFVQSDRQVAFLADQATENRLQPLASLPDPGTDGWVQIWLWDRDNSPEPRLTAVAGRPIFYLDRFTSEIIEFDRSILDRGRLVAGRLWAEINLLDANSCAGISRKSRTFAKWFDRLANWIRRHGVSDGKGCFVLKGAQEFARQGGRLVGSANVP